MIRLAASFLIATAFIGCSSLSVRVDIVNPSVVEAHVDQVLLRDALPFVRAQNDLTVDGVLDAAFDDHRNFYKSLAAEYRTEAATKTVAEEKADLLAMADSLVGDFAIALQPPYDEARARLKRLNAEIRAIDAKEAFPEKEAQMVARLRERDRYLDNFINMIARDTEGAVSLTVERLGADIRDRAEDLRSKLLLKARAEQRALIGVLGLVESSEAYRVVTADDTSWHEDFDRSFGRSRLGDMNLAIKMETPGIFTIKGVTFDPSEVARVASKVTTQALVFSAQLAGVPLKTKTFAASETTTSAATSSGELEAAASQQAQRDAITGDRRDAFLALANTVLAEQEVIKSGSAAQRSAAIKNIKNALDAHKARLNQ